MNKKDEFLTKDIEFSKLVKKAKRKSFFKTVAISLISSLIVIFVVYRGAEAIMYKKMEKETERDSLWSQINGANIESEGTFFDYSLFSATATTNFSKRIGDVRIPWGNEKKMFSLFGGGSVSHQVIASKSGSIDDERIPLYFQGERVVEFYHPKGAYQTFFNDRELLSKIPENKIVEMAFSLDKTYSIEEVKKVFGEHLAWYWVDTYSQKEIAAFDDINEIKKTIKNYKGALRDHLVSGMEAIGFSENVQGNQFIYNLQRLTNDGGIHQEEAQKIYRKLSSNGKKKLSEKTLPIIGVVVVGKPSELQKYNDLNLIRGAILGVTVDEY